jgi:DNA repair protein RadC
MKIHDLPLSMRPREKALQNGISSLSESELLAIIIEKGVQGMSALEIGRSLYEESKSLSTLFSPDFLTKGAIRGLSQVKLLEIKAMGELFRRETLEHFVSLIRPSSRAIFETFRNSLGQEKRESLFVLSYDKSGRFIAKRRLYEGTRGEVSFNHEEILEEVSSKKAHGFYILHNHPSGNPLPSLNEVRITSLLREEGAKKGIKLLDHEIIASNCFFSFADHGLLKHQERV